MNLPVRWWSNAIFFRRWVLINGDKISYGTQAPGMRTVEGTGTEKWEKEKRGKTMLLWSIFNFFPYSLVIIYNFTRANSLDHIFLINSRYYIKNFYLCEKSNN